MQVDPGIFNKKIQIVDVYYLKDADGFPIRVDDVIVDTWAQVTNTSGTELAKNNSDFSQTKTRFFMRTPKQEIDADWTIRFGGEDYNIVYINDYGYEKKYTEIMALKTKI
jgi:SPP1 family predicted phage head-tail adaptor